MNPRIYGGTRRRAFTLSDLMIGGAVMFLFLLIMFIAILLPSLGRARELSRRTVCAANMKGTGTGFFTYAAGNNDEFPIPAHLKPGDDGVSRVRYAPGIIGKHRGSAEDAEAGESTEKDTEVSTTRAMWYLVRSGMASPKAFICPSSNDVPNNEDNPQMYWDFRSYKEVSYGYQVPFGVRGKPSPERDQDVAIAADKGPYGAALEAGQPNPGVPTATAGSSPKQWKKWNSPNHENEGQNVMYPDGHVDFVTTPLAGTLKDNIYTRWSSDADVEKEDAASRIQGAPPTGIETPWSDTDSLIYP